MSLHIGEKLHDFYIGVANTSGTSLFTPIIQNGVPNYHLCHNYSGPVGTGETVEITCSTPSVGQLVIIQIPGPINTLTLCEVEVYGEILFSPRTGSSQPVM